MDFDWRTDEAQEPFEGAEQVQQSRVTPRRWLWLAFFAFLALGSGFFLWREAQQRVAQAEEAVTDEVRAAHRLARRAAAGGDRELFISLLSGRDDEWLEAQLQALEEERLFATGILPSAMRAVGEPQVQEIDLDPGLSEAVVSSEQAYNLTGTAGLTETVTLEHTYVYRSGSQGWLLSPPLDGFWGSEQQYEGYLLSLSYRKRDEQVARRLGPDLDQALNDFCAQSQIACPTELHLSVELATTPGNSVAAADLQQALLEQNDLILLSPTLAGLPVDEAGYQALLQGYATPLVASALAQVTAYDCCRGLPLFSALVQKQLSRLALAPWPIGPDQYERLLEAGVDRATANRLLNDHTMALEDGEQWQRALSMVDFLEDELGQEQLLAEGYGSYRLWLERFDGDLDRFTMEWLDFIHAHSRSGRMTQTAAPAPPSPQGLVQFRCHDIGGESFLLGYDAGNEQWSELIRVAHPLSDTPATISTRLMSLPGGFGHVIQESIDTPEAGEVVRFTWYPDLQGDLTDAREDQIVIYAQQREGEEDISSWSMEPVPMPGFLVLAEYVFGDTFFQANLRTTLLVNIGSCSSDGCASQPLVGVPVWSPSLQQTVLQGTVTPIEQSANGTGTRPSQTVLYRGDDLAQNARPVGRGVSPFWLDDTHYGYLRQAEDRPGQELVIASTVDDRPQVIARNATFSQAMDAVEQPEALTLIDVHPIAGQPTRLLVRARNVQEETGSGYGFALQLEGEDQIAGPDLLYSTNFLGLATPSPAGRWLYAGEFVEPNALSSLVGVTFTLLDLEQDTRRNLGSGRDITWSPDGQWLAKLYEKYVLLWNVPRDYKTVVRYDLSDCRFDSWRDR